MGNEEIWKLDPNSPSGILRWRLSNGSVREWRSEGDESLPSPLHSNPNIQEAATLPFQEDIGDLPFVYMPLSRSKEDNERHARTGNEYNIVTPEVEVGTPLPQDIFRTAQNSLRPDAPEFLPGSETALNPNLEE